MNLQKFSNPAYGGSYRSCSGIRCKNYAAKIGNRKVQVDGLQFELTGTREFLGYCDSCIKELLRRECQKWLTHEASFFSLDRCSKITIDWFNFFSCLKLGEKKQFVSFLKYLRILVKNPVRNRRIKIEESFFCDKMGTEVFYANATVVRKVKKEKSNWLFSLRV